MLTALNLPYVLSFIAVIFDYRGKFNAGVSMAYKNCLGIGNPEPKTIPIFAGLTEEQGYHTSKSFLPKVIQDNFYLRHTNYQSKKIPFIINITKLFSHYNYQLYQSDWSLL